MPSPLTVLVIALAVSGVLNALLLLYVGWLACAVDDLERRYGGRK